MAHLSRSSLAPPGLRSWERLPRSSRILKSGGLRISCRKDYCKGDRLVALAIYNPSGYQGGQYETDCSAYGCKDCASICRVTHRIGGRYLPAVKDYLLTSVIDNAPKEFKIQVYAKTLLRVLRSVFIFYISFLHSMGLLSPLQIPSGYDVLYEATSWAAPNASFVKIFPKLKLRLDVVY